MIIFNKSDCDEFRYENFRIKNLLQIELFLK